MNAERAEPLIALLLVTCSCASLKPDRNPGGGQAGTEGERGGADGSGGSSAGHTGSGGSGAASGGSGASGGESGASSGCGDGWTAGSGPVECPDACEPRTFKCGDENRVLFCDANDHTCPEWIEVRACSAGQLCCDAVCVEATDANCYGCGNQCADLTPACDDEIQACGCTPEACASLEMYCDAATHACVDPSDFYVSAARSGTGSGTTPADPFRTITEALHAAARFEDKAMRVHVASGIYDERLGEQFPLAVPPGVSIEGAGSDKTLISGRGRATEESYGDYLATITVGYQRSIPDYQNFVIRISNVALRPGPVNAGRTYGVFCRSGNAPRAGELKPPPNTQLHGLDISGAYTAGVHVTHSAISGVRGCNLALSSSTISDSNYAIVTEACLDSSRQQHVAIDVGDGTPTGGNEFRNIKTRDTAGAGVFANFCTRLSARHNYFHHSNMGIVIQGMVEYVPGEDHALIENNRFEDLNHTGVLLHGGRIVVDSLSDNRFERILTEEHDAPPLGVGLALLSYDSDEPLPQVVFARNNTFRMNDVAVKIQGTRPLTRQAVSNFGTGGDEGWNVFSCNSTRGTSPFAGADVRLDVPNADGVTIPFSGNVWDHNPPTTIRTSDPKAGNGVDVSMSSTNQVQLDTTDTFLAEEACPEDWLP